MSSSLSVLLVPLQELQAEGHYTSTVGGMYVLSGSPNTGGSVSALYCKSVFCNSVKDLQTTCSVKGPPTIRAMPIVYMGKWINELPPCDDHFANGPPGWYI